MWFHMHFQIFYGFFLDNVKNIDNIRKKLIYQYVTFPRDPLFRDWYSNSFQGNIFLQFSL